MSNLPLTRNVTSVFRSATDAQVERGMRWYADAHIIAASLADAHGITADAAAGIIAALSPLQSWGANVNLAARLIAAGGLTSGYLTNGLNKANAILAGASPVDLLTSNKVRAFYYGIREAGQTDMVCVDRHAYSLAVSTRFTGDAMPTLTGKRYAATAAVYVRAADILSGERGERIHPAQVQAVTWVAWRARYWAEGAFDSHAVKVA